MPGCRHCPLAVARCIASTQVLLLPGRAELVARLQARAASGGHFMPPSLLDSQLAQLELPPDEHLAWRFEGDVLPPPGDIVNTILAGRRDG